MAEVKQAVGKPMSRVDGRLKVTGGARYAAEFQLKEMSYGVLVLSTVAKGRITKIDTATAETAPGVLTVITHRNAGKVVLPEKAKAMGDSKVGRPLHPFQEDQVYYHGQPIAVVIADTFERASHAATLVRASYDEKKAILDFADATSNRFTPHGMKSDRATQKSPHYHRGEPETE